LSVYFITEKQNWNKMVTWSSTVEKKQLWRAESLQNQIFMNCYQFALKWLPFIL